MGEALWRPVSFEAHGTAGEPLSVGSSTQFHCRGLVIWECETKSDHEQLAQRIKAFLG